MRTVFVLMAAVLLGGCASGYQEFYKPYVDARTLDEVELLKPGEEPRVSSTKDFDRDIKVLRSKQYVPLGYSAFNGAYEEDEGNVKVQAKRVGATVVLVNTEYTDTVTTTSPLYVPTSSTTYHSGSVYAGDAYGAYSGTSTTYGCTVVPITTNQMRYDHRAMFFVKSTKKLRFGVFFDNLSDEQRRVLQRNTGATIDVVVEGSPAFCSNVLPGDILIKVNDSDVRDVKHAHELMQAVSSAASSAVFTLIRNGKEQAITIKLDET